MGLPNLEAKFQVYHFIVRVINLSRVEEVNNREVCMSFNKSFVDFLSLVDTVEKHERNYDGKAIENGDI